MSPALLTAMMSALLAQVEFNREVRPILSEHCFPCHGPDANNRKAGIRFDMETGARPAFTPGDAAHSKMYLRISSDNKAQRMPPVYSGQDKLAPRQIETIKRWIDEGAKWQAHWSLIPPRKAPLPKVSRKEWAR